MVLPPFGPVATAIRLYCAVYSASECSAILGGFGLRVNMVARETYAAIQRVIHRTVIQLLVWKSPLNSRTRDRRSPSSFKARN
jgi:hypothetical protein